MESLIKESNGYQVSCFLHSYSRKRRRQEETREVFLQQVELHVDPGTTCAIVGPSGSGKERLLQLLSGRTNKHICLGEVHVNGTPFAAPQMRAMTSFLRGAGQLLIGQMTVGEAVDFTARLVLPSDIDKESRKAKVDRVLQEFNLIEIKDQRIDGGVNGSPISAEQRVRVNLAQVFMEGKKIIYLHEPTRGLDLLAAEQVISDIIGLAETKMLTVFVSLEHPTKLLLEKFQKCLFLSQGRQVYFGRVRHCVDFFSRLGYPIPEETSIVDHILGLTVPDASQTDSAEAYLGKLLNEAYSVFEEIEQSKLSVPQRKVRREQMLAIKKNNYYIKTESDSYLHYPISWAKQVQVLIHRFWVSFKGDYYAFVWRIVFTALWIGLFWVFFANAANKDEYPKDSQNMITSLTCALLGIQGLSMMAMPQAEEFAKIFESDMNQNLYRPSAYVVAHLCVSFLSLPFITVPTAVCYFFFLGLNDYKDSGDTADASQDLIYFGAILLVMAVVCEVLSLSIALLARNPSVMYLTGGGIHLLWLLFCGGVIPLCSEVDDIVSMISIISPTKWALDSLLLLTVDRFEYKYPNGEEEIDVSGSTILEKQYCFKSGDWRHANSETTSFVAMGGMCAFLLLTFFLAARLVQSGFSDK